MKRAILFMSLFCLAISRLSAGTTYYVDATHGNDQNSGLSASSAWKTIARINSSWSQIRTGDDILLKRGETYTDAALNIQKGGTSSNLLVIGAYGTGPKPIIDCGPGSLAGAISCHTPNLSYISIQDLAIRNVNASGGQSIGFNADNISHVQISRVEINGNKDGNGILLYKINTFTIEDCLISNCGNCGIAIIGSPIYPIANGLIRNNIVHDIRGNDAITLHKDGNGYDVGANHQILDNVLYNCGEEGLDITSGDNIILRKNETFANSNGGIQVGHGASNVWIDKHYSHDEKNVGIIIGLSSRVKLTSSIIYNSSYVLITVSKCTELKCYNNAIVSGANSTGSVLEISTGAQDLVFENNLFTSTLNGFPYRLVRYLGGATPKSTGSYFDYNVWWALNPADDRLWWDGVNCLDYSGWKSSWNYESQGSFADPKLVDPSKANFHLRSDSPCIDSGLDVGLTSDFDNTSIPQGFRPDIGAYEYTQTSELSISVGASPTSGQAPLTVNFTGSASGGEPPYSYSWNFGDGQVSSFQNPSHTYSSAGTYTANLSVTDSGNSSSSRSLTITVTIASSSLVASISASPAAGQAPLTVNFSGNATSGSAPYSYRWHFGDGQSSTSQNPIHTYADSGNYIVILTVTDSQGFSDDASQSITVIVPGAQTFELSISSATGSPAPGQGGTTDPSPGNHAYSARSTVQVKSLANENYRFSKWTGEVASGDLFRTIIDVLIDKARSIVANFCTRCGDVTGDLVISPADAQKTFDLYLGKIPDPTWCELENADVNTSGSSGEPKITPADAQVIFKKYLNKGELPSDCSGASRTLQAATSFLPMPSGKVRLTWTELAVSQNSDLVFPVIIDSPFPIGAFGFDLQFPPESLTFVQVETSDFSDRFYQVGAHETSPGVIRVGGYASQPVPLDGPAVLVTFVFRATDPAPDQDSISIANACDDLRNAQIRSGIARQNTERKSPSTTGARRTNRGGKRYDL